MPRHLLPETSLHPAIRPKVATSNRAIVEEVMGAIQTNNVVVVGMGINPFPAKARKALDAIGQQYKYLGYGTYFSEWRRRGALKMWSGWPTLPMVFVKGTLVGGASELQALIDSGDFKAMLAGSRPAPVQA